MFPFLKRVAVLFFSFVSFAVSAQSTQELEQKIEEAAILERGLGNQEKKWANAFELIERSEAAHYDRGIVQGYLTLAKHLFLSSEYEKSLEYLSKLPAYQPYLQAHPEDEHSRLMYLAENYYYLGLTAQAAGYYRQAALLLPSIKDPYRKVWGQFYTLMEAFLITTNPDSLLQKYVQATQVTRSPDYLKRTGELKTAQRFQKQDQALAYIQIAGILLEKAQLDSAQFYFQAAVDELERAGGGIYTVYAHDGLARVEATRKNYSASLQQYQQALALARIYGMSDYLLDEYTELSDIYATLGDHVKAKEYKDRHQTLADSLAHLKNKGANSAFMTLVKDYETALEETREKQKLNLMILSGGAILILVTGVLVVIINRKRKERLHQENTQELTQKAQQLEEKVSESLQILQEKEQETQLLQQKVNESFQELVTLAKQNHPNFYARFQEVYPELHRKLLSIDEDLQLTELTLCAYVYLDFSSKEIAEYTFRSMKTIQNRKHSLRKKLGLETSEDLYVWMKELLSRND